MAHWLARDKPPAFGIEDDENGRYDIALWPDGAITRADVGYKLPNETKRIYARVPGTAILGFIVEEKDGRHKLYEQPISFIPFSTYQLGKRPPQSLAIHYVPPDRENKERGSLGMLAPRGMKLLWHGIRAAGECVVRWNGRDHLLDRPEVVDAATVQAVFSRVQWRGMQQFGIRQCMRLHFRS